MKGRRTRDLWPVEIPLGVLLAFMSVGGAFEVAYGRPDLLLSLLPLGAFLLLYVLRRFSVGAA